MKGANFGEDTYVISVLTAWSMGCGTVSEVLIPSCFQDEVNEQRELREGRGEPAPHGLKAWHHLERNFVLTAKTSDIEGTHFIGAVPDMELGMGRAEPGEEVKILLDIDGY